MEYIFLKKMLGIGVWPRRMGVARYGKEGIVLTRDIILGIRGKRHLRKVDFTVFIITCIGLLGAFRYLSSEVGNSSWCFVGGVCLLLFVVLKWLYGFVKKKV